MTNALKGKRLIDLFDDDYGTVQYEPFHAPGWAKAYRVIHNDTDVGTIYKSHTAQWVTETRDEQHVWHTRDVAAIVLIGNRYCGWCEQEATGIPAPHGTALCADHNRIRLQTL